MEALGLGGVRGLPSLACYGSFVVVLVCYLDDSGKDPQNRIITVAGYVATDEQWKAFEIEVESWFSEFGVNISHAKDLHHTDGEFAGWTVLRKQAFVARLCQAMSRHLQLGVSMSAVKSTYDARAEESDRKRTVRPYTFCFNVIVDWLLRDIRVGRAANTEGVAFILECGHENNPEAEQTFCEIRKLHGLENVLRSISFVPKDYCRAIQMADLIAFYSRRHGQALERAPVNELSDVPPGTMMNLLGGSVPLRTFVATDFGPESVGLPFYMLGQF
jgi:Protein of unknown function (DUF3800)